MTDSADRIHALTSWHEDWTGLRVAVLGLGVTGFAAADTLAELGARVLVVARSAAGDYPAILGVIGVELSLGEDEETVRRLESFEPELIVVSPGYSPVNPLVRWAQERDLPLWGDIELAWRLRDKVGEPAEWIAVTGTNGKTTTVQLTTAMLRTAGYRAVACGNIGTPVLDAIRDPGGFDALVVELSSYQLHYLGAIQPYSSVCLNIAEDHLDWHGGFDEYRAAKAKVYEGTKIACVYNLADPVTEELVLSLIHI